MIAYDFSLDHFKFSFPEISKQDLTSENQHFGNEKQAIGRPLILKPEISLPKADKFTNFG